MVDTAAWVRQSQHGLLEVLNAAESGLPERVAETERQDTGRHETVLHKELGRVPSLPWAKAGCQCQMGQRRWLVGCDVDTSYMHVA